MTLPHDLIGRAEQQKPWSKNDQVILDSICGLLDQGTTEGLNLPGVARLIRRQSAELRQLSQALQEAREERDRLARESSGRLRVVNQLYDEKRAEWLRAEQAEAELAHLRSLLRSGASTLAERAAEEDQSPRREP